MGLSVAIITLNEERNLARTLASVKNIADEIIILDCGSMDETEEIAKSFGAKFIYQKWLGYGEQKNRAIELCENELILNIDADEEITPELATKIQEVKINPSANAYLIGFNFICFGRHLKYGDWGLDKRIRLFKKGYAKYDAKEVHETLTVEGSIMELKERLNHYSYLSVEDYFAKFNRYTSQAAREAFKQGKKYHWYNFTLSPIFKFLKSYIFRLGFLDGWEGFIFATYSSLYTITKYFKLRELYKNIKS